MWKQEHPSLLERQVADLNIKMAVVLALVSLYGCMQTARYEHAGLQTLLSFFFFCSQQTLGGSGAAHGTTVMSPESVRFTVCLPSLPSAPTTFSAPGLRFHLTW